MRKKEIEKALRDYHWMIKEIRRQRELMSDIGGNIIAKIDDMPKGKGTTGDPVVQEVLRREKNNRWLMQLERKVVFIQKRMHTITDEREKAVLQCMLDGMGMGRIARHMGISRTNIYEIKDRIVASMEKKEQIGQKEHI